MKYILTLLFTFSAALNQANAASVISDGLVKTDLRGKSCFVGVTYKKDSNNKTQLVYQGPTPTVIFTRSQQQIMNKCGKTKNAYISISRTNMSSRVDGGSAIEVICKKLQNSVNASSTQAYQLFKSHWQKAVNQSKFKYCP